MSQEESAAVATKAPGLVTDALFLAGIVSTFSGVAMVYFPAALIIAGVLMVLLALRRERAT